MALNSHSCKLLIAPISLTHSCFYCTAGQSILVPLYPKAGLCILSKRMCHTLVGRKKCHCPTGGEQWPHPSLPLPHPGLLLSPVWSVVQVGAAASGGEISCLSQSSPVKCKLLKAHRSCVCSEAAVFSLAQHSPAACSDMSSV